jgi:hypothetical protein
MEDPRVKSKANKIDRGATNSRFLRSAISLVFATCSILLTAQSAMGSLEGTIHGPNGKAFPNCTVTISSFDGNRITQGTTDKHGKYQIKQLSSGWYRVTVRPPYFGDQLYLNYETSIVVSAVGRTSLSAVLKWKQDPREDCKPGQQVCF